MVHSIMRQHVASLRERDLFGAFSIMLLHGAAIGQNSTRWRAQ